MATCHDCGVERANLHQHHIIPKSQGGPNTPDNLVGLCSNCHEDRHGGSVGGRLRGLNSHSPEAQAKKSAVMKAHWQDPEYRARGEAALRSPEKRAAGSAAQKALWADPEYRASITPKITAVLLRPETQKAAAEARLRWLAVPGNRERENARLAEMSRSSEIRARKRATNKRLGRKPPPPTAEMAAHARQFLHTPEAEANWRAAMEKVRADPAVKAKRQATMKEKWSDPAYAAEKNRQMGRGGEICKRGHAFSGPNLYIDGRGRRVCRTCKAEASRASRARLHPDVIPRRRPN